MDSAHPMPQFPHSRQVMPQLGKQRQEITSLDMESCPRRVERNLIELREGHQPCQTSQHPETQQMGEGLELTARAP